MASLEDSRRVMKKGLLMAYAFRKYKTIAGKYQDSVKYIVGDTLLAQLNVEDKQDSSSIIALIERYDISKKEKDELLEMYRETEGKVIFHDFWFTNCGPCMKELPNYNVLIASVDQDVVFVFYGVYMQDSEWKEARERLDSKGRHHLLTKNQLAFFEKYFKLNGFPHHQLINTKGQIIGERIPGVYPANFDYIMNLIAAQQ